MTDNNSMINNVVGAVVTLKILEVGTDMINKKPKKKTKEKKGLLL